MFSSRRSMMNSNSFCIKFSINLSLLIFGLFFYCEYLIYYLVLIQCDYPELNRDKADPIINVPIEENPVKAMFIADTHLLGQKKGHWFDKLRREWQMHRAFQTMMTLHQPDIVFVLGDVFDEGQWSSVAEFDQYVKRFHSLFSVPKNTYLYVVAGNHDIGFHYVVTPYLNQRFINNMKAPSVRRISLRGNHFVLMNSVALEKDSCFLCKPAEIALNKIAKQLKCAKNVSPDCNKSNAITSYSRPILLQHYPMYRESDEICNELDEAPESLKKIKFREKWDCLSKEASNQLLDILNPRLIVDGHTHHGCKKIHRDDILEFTVPSFSWRNKDNPSLLLGLFTPNNFSVAKCYMPVESVVIKIYCVGIICIVFLTLLKCRQRSRRKI